MNTCPKCCAPFSECEVSARRFYCPNCKFKAGLNFEYHIAFILTPVIVAFVYCLIRTMV